MLTDMRYHFELAEQERKKRKAFRDADLVASEYRQAREAAVKAAPYIHPQLATLQSNVSLSGKLTLEALVQQSMPLPANANVPLIDVTPKADVE